MLFSCYAVEQDQLYSRFSQSLGKSETLTAAPNHHSLHKVNLYENLRRISDGLCKSITDLTSYSIFLVVRPYGKSCTAL